MIEVHENLIAGLIVLSMVTFFLGIWLGWMLCKSYEADRVLIKPTRQSKLSDEQVRAIRSHHRLHSTKAEVLAEEFNVHIRTIRRLLRGITYRDVR